MGGWSRCKLYRLCGDERENQQVYTQNLSCFKVDHSIVLLSVGETEDEWWTTHNILRLPALGTHTAVIWDPFFRQELSVSVVYPPCIPPSPHRPRVKIYFVTNMSRTKIIHHIISSLCLEDSIVFVLTEMTRGSSNVSLERGSEIRIRHGVKLESRRRPEQAWSRAKRSNDG